MSIRAPIRYARQSITEADIAAVTEVLRSDFLTQGPQIAAFEKAFADYVGTKFAVAVCNGTAALHLCQVALGTQPGQRVITSPITFAATANSVCYCGGEVVFADINLESYCLDINEVKELLTASPKGTYSGIMPVDFAGYPVDLEAFRELADSYGLWLLEDACHAPGGAFKDSKGTWQSCGNNQYADCAIFSFHPVKHIAAGEGGMITTADEALYKRLLQLRTHGITKPASAIEQNGSWFYELEELGYNYRLTDIQAALGLSQLQRADEGFQRRQQIAARYDVAFEPYPEITTPSFDKKTIRHAYHLYVIQVEQRRGLYEFLRSEGIFCQVHYIPLHLMPYYRKQGWKAGNCPSAEAYYDKALSLPMYPSLTEEEQEFVIERVLHFTTANGR